MVDYPYRMQLVVDPDNPRNVVAGGSVSIYDSADTGKTTLLALTDPSGVPIPNPISSNSQGFTPPFVCTSPEVLWVSGPYEDYFQSYKGMRDEAAGARQAAETAAANAGAAAQADLEARIAAGQFKGDKGADGANVLPTDDAIEQEIKRAGSKTQAALSATYASYIQLAKNPDTLIAGAVTVDASNLVTSAVVQWPDGSPGTLTITSRDANGAVLGYNITYGSPVTKTFTQPTITRNAAGAATNVPQIVVS